MSKIPISLIVDDSGPVNTYHFHDPGHEHSLQIPPAFAEKFAHLAQTYGIRGKFSVVPVPAGLGRIDEAINRVPDENRREYIRIIRDEIAPNFSLTPEILTHFLYYNLLTGRCGHTCEDIYFSTLDAAQIAEYVGFAIEVLQNVGLQPHGVTSPWCCGIDNEENYARGIGMAFRKHTSLAECFYFLHCEDDLKNPKIVCNSPETGRVVSIPANTFDPFWDTQNPILTQQAVENVKNNINQLLSQDGTEGIIPELMAYNYPVTIVTHWQSLFSDGRNIGLEGLEALTQRIQHALAQQVEWTDFECLAKLST